jgi:hypothetical protein
VAVAVKGRRTAALLFFLDRGVRGAALLLLVAEGRDSVPVDSAVIHLLDGAAEATVVPLKVAASSTLSTSVDFNQGYGRSN